MRQTNGAHVTAAAFEAVGDQGQVAGFVSTVQLAETLLGVREKGIEQVRKPAFHYIPQRTDYFWIHMYIGHLLTP